MPDHITPEALLSLAEENWQAHLKRTVPPDDATLDAEMDLADRVSTALRDAAARIASLEAKDETPSI